MEIFLDSVNLDEIKELREFICGITTNPSLIAKSGYRDKYEILIGEICSIIDGPVSVEVVANNYRDIIEESLKLTKIAGNVVVKLPLTYEGLISCKKLWTEHRVSVNITLCFSPGQALLAAKVGACFVSPFVGRLDDIGCSGLSMVRDIRTIYSNYGFDTKILVASVRDSTHVIEAAKLGVDSITLPAKVLRQLLDHPLTERGFVIFERDWNAK
ncbi:MAG: transaldolase family protein [Wolbachia endosymbiont of Menacanthus eurysternus]|nr:MAG: transaldolase family protein [Wolbachia endosymbiont of Menacanthus eurysternus]